MATMLIQCLIASLVLVTVQANVPFILTTWDFAENATNKAYDILTVEGGSLLDAVERGISESCELYYCSHRAGPFAKVDEGGDLSLDAMLMDGSTYSVGAVGGLRRIRTPISVARAVMKYTKSTLLVGDDATAFAEEMGFESGDLRTTETNQTWLNWRNNNCQPNFRQNVVPDPSENCGPYTPIPDDVSLREAKKGVKGQNTQHATFQSHPRDLRFKRHLESDTRDSGDTICQIGMGDNGETVVGVSTNGLDFKIPGRVGDSPVPGAGGYAVSNIGAAVATGNGDVMLRFLPSFTIVENMRRGMSPEDAAEDAIERMFEFHPDVNIAVMGANVDGDVGVACYGYQQYEYWLRNPSTETAIMITVNCEDTMKRVRENLDNKKRYKKKLDAKKGERGNLAIRKP